jgi:hypothetical protein
VPGLPTNRSDRAATYLSLTVAGQWRIRTAFPFIPRLLVRAAASGNLVEYTTTAGWRAAIWGVTHKGASHENLPREGPSY